jgi:hypothetical protein
MHVAAIDSYTIDTETPAVERAAWAMVEAAARQGLFNQVRAGQVSTLDLKFARQFLESRASLMQIPPEHRAMYLKLIGEAERFLRANSKLERPTALAGDVGGLGNIFDAIWSGVKAVSGIVAKGAKGAVKIGTSVFKAGATTQANAATIQANAEKIAADVANTVKSARSVTDAVAGELTAGKVDSIAGGFLKSDTGKWVLIGGAAVVLFLVARGGGRAPATSGGGRR